ncbi:MAG: hypothetical protein AUK06_00735 [Parcubacteria group bacterium CG2_30_36_18]|nr:MAG: hypothetical protein AUK06_00735 [Parcubacteria group bacterium CG2_30_36_18]
MLHWSQNLILVFVSVFSFLFLPVSLLLINRLTRFKSEKNIFQGGIITGIFSILFGAMVPMINFFNILLINFGRVAGDLICNSGRSGLISQKLKENPEEAGAMDTIFSPLGIALGALISGSIIGFLGFQLLFIFGGIFIIVVGILTSNLAKKGTLR